ncbi:hypothetical protein [Flavilitoribacter nigricans]|uniref:Uncharacterized protein n=1 Tax=Flavilitoribacter nigricans (strain ATCC 23147 / DSM 23189 / NBRC 102662 / NCIMB 1420 / SS-2) TaxID=1122177 RepID=A0A2D0NEM5_FLAN2|nr:hypothetical protein [Flavilitoribacter nigricans]PHN06961.1 hypothetical protein CRP01_09095 [Flavilitoribacter nigricans DSM 23189 = NBRC 102662]
MQNKQTLPALVKDPYTGRRYDLGPLFFYLNDSRIKQPADLARHFEQSSESVPLLIEDDSPHIREMQKAFELLTGLKHVFQSIREVD